MYYMHTLVKNSQSVQVFTIAGFLEYLMQYENENIVKET